MKVKKAMSHCMTLDSNVIKKIPIPMFGRERREGFLLAPLPIQTYINCLFKFKTPPKLYMIHQKI